MKPFKGIVAYSFIALNTVAHCVPLYAMALVRSVVRGPLKTGLNKRMDGIIDTWVAGNRSLCRSLGLFRVELSGTPLAELKRDQWYLVVCNHQTWADIIVLQNTLRHAVPPLKFFTKQQLLWLPFLGYAMKLLGFPYVKRPTRAQIEANPELKKHDREATTRACEAFQERPVAILNFLEGTRFTLEKQAAQEAPYQHLLRPKVGGAGFVIQALEGKLDKLVDITLSYPGPTPSFFEFLSGACPVVHMHVRVLPLPAPAACEAQFREALGQQFHDLWQVKDEHLAARAEVHRV